MLAGVIVGAMNQEEGTLLEIYQTEMNSRTGEPIDLDESEGRFLAFYKGFLEQEIYRQGRKVTVAGVVKGERVRKLGELDYHYPYVVVREIHLWPKEKPRTYYPYPGPWYYDPWYSHHPWRPWWPHYRYW